MTIVFIRVEKGDIVGTTRRGKPYPEYKVGYRAVNRESDLGKGFVWAASSGAKTLIIEEAKKMAKQFWKQYKHTSRIQIHDCGKANNGVYTFDGERFRKVK